MSHQITEEERSLVRKIIFINTLVFLGWFFSPASRSYYHSSFMQEQFLVSWESLQEGRFWTLLTAVFSHNMFWHFLMNMLVLGNFGPIIERCLGSKSFIRFYLFAGIFSSFSHSLISAFLLKQPQLPALGASGAISGVILLFSFLFPQQKVLVLGLIPLPAFWGALLFVGLDIWGLVAQVEGGGLPIGHGAHLGGAFIGVIYYFLFMRRKRRHF